MEAQPFVLGLRFGLLLFTGQSDVFPLVEGSITLLVLSLYWWALLVRQVIQPRIGEQWANLLYLPGLFVTFAMIVGTHTAFVDNIPRIVFAAALSAWIWRRGMARVEQGLQEEHLITALKVGFIVLLAMLLFTIVYPKPVYKVLLDALVYALPMFFLSGVVALSLSHLVQSKGSTRAALLEVRGLTPHAYGSVCYRSYGRQSFFRQLCWQLFLLSLY